MTHTECQSQLNLMLSLSHVQWRVQVQFPPSMQFAILSSHGLHCQNSSAPIHGNTLGTLLDGWID